MVEQKVAGHFAERHFAERHFAERHFAERHFAEQTMPKIEISSKLIYSLIRFAYTVKVSVIKVIVDFDVRYFINKTQTIGTPKINCKHFHSLGTFRLLSF